MIFPTKSGICPCYIWGWLKIDPKPHLIITFPWFNGWAEPKCLIIAYTSHYIPVQWFLIFPYMSHSIPMNHYIHYGLCVPIWAPECCTSIISLNELPWSTNLNLRLGWFPLLTIYITYIYIYNIYIYIYIYIIHNYIYIYIIFFKKTITII